MKKELTGGFKAEREFGFALAERFPNLDLTGVDIDGVAIVVEIDSPRGLNLFKLSRVLVGVANGGVKTAIIDLKARNMQAAISLFNLFVLVDESVQLKELRKLEAAIRMGA